MAHKKPETHKDVVKLCKDCDACPSADFSDGKHVILKDDFGGTVKLTHDQAKMLGDEIIARGKTATKPRA